MDLGPYPSFDWSQSRIAALNACARRYYYRTYGSWEGWLDDADPESRVAYRLKQLTTLDMVFGNIVHEFAHELTDIVRAGRELPSTQILERRARNRLNERWQVSGENFIAAPKQEKMLHGFYYYDGPSEKAVERVRGKLNVCVANLHDLDIWERIRRGPLRVIRSHDPNSGFTPPSLELDGVGVFANPDLIVWDEAEEIYVVVEWKTGEVHASDKKQMALYGLYADRNLPDAPATGRLVYLQDGSQETVEFTDELRAQILATVQDGIERMRQYVADQDLNAPVPKEEFVLTDDRWKCRDCNFFELCEDELRKEGSLPWEEKS